MKLLLCQLCTAIIAPQKSRISSKQSPLHPKMIAKEIAAKVAQFEYELDFRGVQTHSPDLVQASKASSADFCLQASSAELCRPASRLHRFVQASSTDELQGQFSSKTCDCCR
jgi:hypothetical protein